MNQLVECAPALPPVRLSRRQVRCLAQSDYLEEAGSPRLVRLATFTIGAMVCGFLIWAGVARIDETAVTPGSVIPSLRNQVVQHPDGGVVTAVLARDGSLVETGQTLLKLNDAAAVAEINRMRARLNGLKLKSVRLLAFATEREPDFSFAGPEYRGLVEDQATIFRAQVNSRNSQRDVLRQQIAQRKAEQDGFDAREATAGDAVALLEEELKMRETLHKQQLQSKILYLDVQRRVNEARGDLAAVRNERQKSADALAEARSRLVELDTRLQTEALSEMGEVTGEIAEVHQTIVRLEDQIARLDIKAPVAGIVKGLQMTTAGGVIGAGEPIVEIVPTGKLVAETRISTTDIGHVRVGQPVKVKVNTFDFARYGAVPGTLVDVSASTFVDEQGLPYYKGTIWLDQQFVGADPRQNELLPGMTVQADIGIGDKTLLQYILKPVYASIHSSFRER